MKANNALCSPIKVEVSIYPHKVQQEGRSHLQGHYLRVNGLFSLWMPQEIQPFQFIGLHKCMCITLARPETIRDLIGVAIDLQNISGNKQSIMWLGSVRTYKSGVGLKMYIPGKIWDSEDPTFMGVYKTAGVLEAVVGAQRKPYYMLNIPKLTRKMLINKEPRQARK